MSNCQDIKREVRPDCVLTHDLFFIQHDHLRALEDRPGIQLEDTT